MTNNTSPRKPIRSTAVELITRLALALALAVIGCLFALSHDEPAASVAATSVVPALAGHVEEDDPRFDCRIDGNQVCGEGATVAGEHVPAGDYSDGDQVAGPVGECLAALGYTAGPVVRSDAELCAGVVEVTDAMVEAQWECFGQLGYDTTQDAIEVSAEDVSTCRRAALAQA